MATIPRSSLEFVFFSSNLGQGMTYLSKSPHSIGKVAHFLRNRDDQVKAHAGYIHPFGISLIDFRFTLKNTLFHVRRWNLLLLRYLRRTFNMKLGIYVLHE